MCVMNQQIFRFRIQLLLFMIVFLKKKSLILEKGTGYEISIVVVIFWHTVGQLLNIILE